MNHLQEAEIKFECINPRLDFVIGDDVLMQPCSHFYFKWLHVITMMILIENKTKRFFSYFSKLKKNKATQNIKCMPKRIVNGDILLHCEKPETFWLKILINKKLKKFKSSVVKLLP